MELAAARTRSLSLGDIVERIDDRFRLLTTGGRTAEPRQQTLRRVVDWSYDLLFADEQRVFRRLSVFAGGFDLAAAEAVCAGDDVAVGDIVDILGHLVDKSLVSVIEPRRRHPLPAACRPSSTTAASGSVEAGEADATRDRHLRWMVEFAADGRARPARTRPAALDPPAGLRSWTTPAPRWSGRQQRGRAADAVAMAAGLAYGWYITGAVARRARPSSSEPSAMEGESSAEQRAVAGAWGAWLTQIGSGAATSDAVDCAEQARGDRPWRFGRGGSARRPWWRRCCAPTGVSPSRRPS